jgi:hypothetical protein
MCIHTDITQGFCKDYFSYLPDSIGLAHWKHTFSSTGIATSGSTFTLISGVDNVFRLRK